MNLYQVTCFPARNQTYDFYTVKAKTPRQAAEIVRDVIQEHCDVIPGVLLHVIPGVLLHVTHLIEPESNHHGYCYPIINAVSAFYIKPTSGLVRKVRKE